MSPGERTRARWATLVLVGLLIVAAGLAVAFATAPNGPGLSVDSASYELAATSYRDEPWRIALVLNGVFPPGYPAAIAGALSVAATPRDAALVVNTLSLGATIALVAASVASARPRRGIEAVAVPAAAALLLATSAGMLRWTGYVMAELLSIACVVAAVSAAAIAVTRPRWLVVAGVAAGAAGLARHGALATVPTLAVLVPLLMPGRAARLRAGASIAVAGVVTWYVGTRLLLDGPPESRRSIVWHPPGSGDLRQLVDTLGSYWLPAGLGVNGIRTVTVGVVILAVALGVRAVRRGGAGVGGVPAVAVLAAGVAITHVVVLAASKAWLDRAIVADDRLVLPVVPLVVLAVGAAWPTDTSQRPRLRAVGAGLLVVVLLAQADRTVDWARAARRDGIEYGQRRFASSPTLAAVRAMPPSTLLWTNDVSLLSLRADRQAFPIPPRTDSYSGQTDPAFEANLEALRDSLRDGGAVVYVDGFAYPLLLSPDELRALVPGLVAEPHADGLILRAGA